ncbi:BamA/TamA family outer membrane protein [uncultured Ferrimonas sp.]|uniref:BamA/TamA family outer membrane protein n=1 Tax=uncultured Ferrimonas sp. TaxID=432640 RepID=UPI002602A17C|nr:BamA/TamA family outer membrane protein [uncultured Ferrimonas sp.]
MTLPCLRFLALPLCLLALPAAAADQSKILPWPWADQLARDTLEWLGADGEFDPSNGIDWGLIPGPVYSPEKQFGIGLSAVGLFIADDTMTEYAPSSITLKGYGSSNGSIGTELEVRSHFQHDSRRFYLDINLEDAPDSYYGIGIAEGRPDRNEVEFDRRSIQLAPRFLWRIAASTYAGVGIDFQRSEGSSLKPQQPDNRNGFGTDSQNLAISGHWVYDSRDFALNAASGKLLQADIKAYSKDVGSEQSFQQLALIYSQYQPIGAATLAWQVQSQLSQGDVPWDQMAQLGGSRKLRGYDAGRYRDNQLLMAQAEWRQPLYGRHGAVAWVGMGTLADKISQLGQEKWLHSIGVGYRFAIKSNVNLRLDLAFGNGDKGAYFSVNEVF